MNDSATLLEDIRPVGKHSLLNAHLDLLAGKDALHPEEAKAIAVLQDIPWPELPPRKKHTQPWIPGILLAACLAFVLLRMPEQVSDISVKGTTKLFLVLEREGKTRVATKDESFVAGDRINVEIAAGEHIKAFMGVFNRSGVALSRGSDIIDNALTIEAGKKAFFKTAVELTKENDGEQLLVVTCRADSWSTRFKDSATFINFYFYAVKSPKGTEDVCQSQWFKLRD